MKQYIVGRRKDAKTGIEILRAGAPPPEPCKECKKEPRRIGSSRCEKCSQLFKEQQLNKKRLQKKIDEQAKL